MASLRLMKLACLSIAFFRLSGATLLPDGRSSANVLLPPGLPVVAPPSTAPARRDGRALAPLNTTYLFNQLIDHENPSLGTFKQRYWTSSEFYEPGGPILMMSPGEKNADGYWAYLTNGTIIGKIAQNLNGTSIMLEHRFYGQSNPFPDLTVNSLRVHTIQQAIEDYAYFAQNVRLPQPNGENIAAPKTPWILVGGSYSAALVSWAMVNKPGLFWGGYSSSGVVQAITDYWEYFEPIRTYMPQNCSADVQAVIAHVDRLFTSTDQTAIAALKANFGLSALSHVEDVAGALRNNLWDFQSLQPSSGPGATFYKFCDALEVKNGQNAPASGWGLETALPAWGNFMKNGYITQRKYLSGNITDCFDTYDPTIPFYTSTAVDDRTRAWTWIVCNEVGWYQGPAPDGHPTLVSRLTKLPYDSRQCQLMFPGAFRTAPPIPAIDQFNMKYKGWNVTENRLFFVNGQRDPWRAATVSRDGLNIPSTASQPIVMVDAFHCSDLKIGNQEDFDPSIKVAQTKAVTTFGGWWASRTV